MLERYDILEHLGEGGAGTVFKAWDKRLQRFVAIKRLLPPDRREGDGVGADLAREASALSSLQHPNIVSVYDLAEWDGEPCVVMEFLNGETLEQTVRRGALTPSDFKEVTRQMLEGIVAAHRLGLQHRDIKPSNIMVNWLPSGGFLAKVLDFGLADFNVRPHKQISDDETSTYGSVHFMAPEQFVREPVDVRTDLYSLGCVLYYALSGNYPFQGRKMEEVINAHLEHRLPALSSFRPDVPALLCQWVEWLMSRRPDERPPTAEKALEVFRQVTSGTLREQPWASQHRASPRAQRQMPGSAATPAAPSRGNPPAASAGVGVAISTRQPLPARGTAPAAAQQAPTPASLPISKKPMPSTSGSTQRTRVEPAPAPSGKRNWTMIAGIAAGGLAVIGLVVFLTTRKPSSPDEAGGSPASSAETAMETSPPASRLAMWFVGGKGCRTGKGSREAAVGETFDYWADQATEVGGANPAHYINTTSNEAERLSKMPRWEEAGESEGLNGRHGVVHFSGQQCLLLVTDSKKVNSIPMNAELLSETDLTVWIVFKSTSTSPGMLMTWMAEGPSARTWEWVVNGDRLELLTPSAKEKSSLPLPPGFVIGRLDYQASGRLSFSLTDRQGKSAESQPLTWRQQKSAIVKMRLGGAAHLRANSSNNRYFSGEVAELLIYTRRLEPAEAAEVQGLLARKYFPASK